MAIVNCGWSWTKLVAENAEWDIVVAVVDCGWYMLWWWWVVEWLGWLWGGRGRRN